MMRHVLAPSSITTRPLGVGVPSATAGLVAPSRVAPRAPPGADGAITGAINLPAIATAADQRPGTAPRAHEHPGGWPWIVIAATGIRWTHAVIGGILAPHACPARCGARRRA